MPFYRATIKTKLLAAWQSNNQEAAAHRGTVLNKTGQKSVSLAVTGVWGSAACTYPRSFLENVRNKGTLQTCASCQMEEVGLARVQKRQKDTEYFYSVF